MDHFFFCYRDTSCDILILKYFLNKYRNNLRFFDVYLSHTITKDIVSCNSQRKKIQKYIFILSLVYKPYAAGRRLFLNWFL